MYIFLTLNQVCTYVVYFMVWNYVGGSVQDGVHGDGEWYSDTEFCINVGLVHFSGFKFLHFDICFWWGLEVSETNYFFLLRVVEG